MEQFRKFPRTYHLFEVQKGRMARDDLLLDKTDAKPFYTLPVTVEEKIDGSNLGLSLEPIDDGTTSNGNGSSGNSPTTRRILAQNRSHYVTSQSHGQFKALDTWINEHYDALYRILSPNYILFGEWLYAKHSIHYDRLPGYFVAFDVYDRTREAYLSVAERNRRLKGSGIPIIKSLVRDEVLGDRKRYEQLLETRSEYSLGPNVKVEGVYVRVDDPQTGLLKHRCKIVRPDFIQTVDTSGHWMTKEVVKNQIDFEWLYSDHDQD